MNMRMVEPPPAWEGLARTLAREHGFEPLEVEGSVPDWLSGTLYRNGAARFEIGNERVGHLFDGDGAITAIRFGEKVLGASRFVHTPEMDFEAARGKQRYGGFGTRSKWPMWDFLTGQIRNTANTSVLPWQGRLFALWEGGLPTEIDPDELGTIGRTDLDGVIPSAFSAHPHRVPSRAATYNIGVRMGRQNYLDLFELPDEGPARLMTSLPIDVAMAHDFVCTERHAVLMLSPLMLDWWRLPLGTPFGDALDWRGSEGTEIVIISLDDPTQVRRFRAPPFYQWHFANAFVDDEEIVVDLVRYPDWDTNNWLQDMYLGKVTRESMGRVVRGRIRGEQLDFEEIWDRSTEFPVIDPRVEGRRHSVCWINAHRSAEAARSTPLDRIARIEVDTGIVTETDLGPNTYPAEPIFVPRPGGKEGEGLLLSLTCDARNDRSFVGVLDATTLAVHARCFLPSSVPQTFHGRFVAG
jgi:all-trans-8'-apo-beta-carotenal 15,15'-oxygenase